MATLFDPPPKKDGFLRDKYDHTNFMKHPMFSYELLADLKERKSHHLMSRSQLANPSVYPCSACDNCGWTHDRYDCDPVEGYKNADKIICKKCNGSGKTTLDVFVEDALIPEMQQQQKENDLEFRKNVLLKKLATVLLPSEYKLLKNTTLPMELP